MARVRLKIPPTIAPMLNAHVSDWLILDKDIGEGATISDLLTGLALNYPDFRKVVFNPDTGKINDQVDVVLNDTLLPLSRVTETRINDGDTIILLLVYSGG